MTNTRLRHRGLTRSLLRAKRMVLPRQRLCDGHACPRDGRQFRHDPNVRTMPLPPISIGVSLRRIGDFWGCSPEAGATVGALASRSVPRWGSQKWVRRATKRCEGHQGFPAMPTISAEERVTTRSLDRHAASSRCRQHWHSHPTPYKSPPASPRSPRG